MCHPGYWVPELNKSGKVARPISKNLSEERKAEKVCYPVFGRSKVQEYLTAAEVVKAKEEDWARVTASIGRVC